MKTFIVAALATLAFAANASAAPMQHSACTGSSFTPHGVWDCR
jgi:hypothetical protein